MKLDELWYDENIWDVHLPAGSYRLCLATHGIDQEGLAPVLKSAPIAAGRRRIALDQTQEDDVRRITVAGDGSRLFEAVEPKEWDPGIGSTGGGHHTIGDQFPADQPVVLFRRRFHLSQANGQTSPPIGPTDGLLLWIEPTETPKPGATPRKPD